MKAGQVYTTKNGEQKVYDPNYKAPRKEFERRRPYGRDGGSDSRDGSGSPKSRTYKPYTKKSFDDKDSEPAKPKVPFKTGGQLLEKGGLYKRPGSGAKKRRNPRDRDGKRDGKDDKKSFASRRNIDPETGAHKGKFMDFVSDAYFKTKIEVQNGEHTRGLYTDTMPAVSPSAAPAQEEVIKVKVQVPNLKAEEAAKTIKPEAAKAVANAEL